MDKSMLVLLMKMMGGQNSSQNMGNGTPIYPQEAFSGQMQGGQNNFLPMLLSLLGKGNSPLSGVMEATKKTSLKEDFSSPNDEILL